MIAANYGLPLLAANHSSFREIYDESCSILYDDIQIGLQQLSSLTEVKYDKMLTECKKLKDRFSGKKIASEIINYIKQI